MQIQRFGNPYRNLVMKNYVSPHLFYFPGNVSSQGKTYLFSFLQDSSQIKKSNGVFLRRVITSAGLFQINIFTWNGTNILPEVAFTCHSEWELSSDQEPKSHHEMTGIHGWKQKVPLFTQTGLNYQQVFSINTVTLPNTHEIWQKTLIHQSRVKSVPGKHNA